MWNNKLCLYLHLVWSTFDRAPLITSKVERPLYRVISSQAIKLGCTVLAINGMSDHLHLVVKFPSTISVAELVKKSKGVSSRFVNKILNPDEVFKWQAGYSAFTISRWDLHKILLYVVNQKHHHSDGFTDMDLESMPEDKSKKVSLERDT